MTESKEETFPFEKLTLAELLTTDFLVCSQCGKRYNSPILLPCLHTLCQDCVTTLIASDENHKDSTITNDTNSNSTDVSPKSRSSPTSDALANDTNGKTKVGSLKSPSRTDAQVKDTNKNGSNKPVKTRPDSKCISANGDSRHVITSIPGTDAKCDSSNIDASSKSTSVTRTDSKSNSTNENRKLSLITNGDAKLESTSDCDSKHPDTTNNETKSTKLSDPHDPAVLSKSGQATVKQIRIQCPLCLSVIETNVKKLKLANTFVQHLCEVRNYKDENGRSCEYCKYDGKTTTATTLCLHCHDDMCDACVKAHQRTRVTRDHKLAPYEQIQKGLYDHDIRNHQSIFCVSHNITVDVFCLTCAVLLCRECKMDKHKEHKVLHITKIFPKYKQQLESFLQGMKRRIPTVSDYSDFLTNHNKQMNQTREVIEKVIQNQAELLHKLIDEHKTKLIDNLSEACNEEQEGIQMKCKGLNTAQSSLTKNTEFLSHLLKFGKPEEVLLVHQQVTDRLRQLVNMKPDNLTMRLSTLFTPGSATEQNIAIMFGNLVIEKVPFTQKDSQHSRLTVASLMPIVLSPPELVTSFDMKGNDDSTEVWPTGLAVTDNNYVIVDRDNKVVKIFKKNGKLETQFCGKGENRLGSPFDATILKNGNIAVTDYKSENVKVFDQSGKFVMAINGHFRYPRGITTNNKGDIVVVDCHKLQITTHNSETGECISTISGNDEINKHLVDPYYITVTDNDNFVVTDHAAPNIKIFNQKGECLAQYGTYGTNKGQVLQPYGVCVDRHGYIFVADHQNSRIHLLLPDGRFCKFLLTKLDKLRNPVTIGIDNDDQLLVAEALGNVKVWKYI